MKPQSAAPRLTCRDPEPVERLDATASVEIRAMLPRGLDALLRTIPPNASDDLRHVLKRAAEALREKDTATLTFPRCPGLSIIAERSGTGMTITARGEIDFLDALGDLLFHTLPL